MQVSSRGITWKVQTTAVANLGSKGAARGFAMIELMITLAVIAILAAIAAPYFRDIILANQMAGYTNDLVQTFYAARIEAIKQTKNISVGVLNPDDIGVIDDPDGEDPTQTITSGTQLTETININQTQLMDGRVSWREVQQ